MKRRFKKGDKVEVMNDREMPISWRPAEILSYRGHNCTVQYLYYPGITTDQVIERISKDSIRPLPQALWYEGNESFDAGDVVEVFHDCSWKVAAILKNLGDQRVCRRKTAYKQAAVSGSHYLVRLVGCSLQLIVDVTNMRTRRTWDGNKWVLMEKNFRAAGYLTANKVPNYEDTSLREPTEISLPSRKRMSPFGSSTAYLDSSRHIKKLRIVMMESPKNKVAAEKVHAVSYPVLGEQSMHVSNNIISARCNQFEREKHDNQIGLCGSRRFELSPDDSETSSVGSCSITSHGMNYYYRSPITAMFTEADAICSDAESCCILESDREASSSPPCQVMEVSTHRYEVHAYRCTLQALFVSGPLTWEQETLLTNLRRLLHISNDEHLEELKLLLSTKKSPLTV